MELTTVSCNSCGAPLQVPAGAKFVTCNHCSCQLAVKHTDSVTFTEQLGEISERTEQIAEDVAELKYRQELEDLDRQWERERESYMVSDKHGRRHVPSRAGGLIGAVVAVVFGIFWIKTTSHGGAPAMFPLFGVLFIVVGIFVGIGSCSDANDYRKAEQAYRRKRAAVRRGRG